MLLSKAAAYSDERIKSANIERKDFVTTDSMLQNKGGINHSVTLPKGNLISFRKGDILVGNIRPYLKKIWYANRNGGCSPDVLVIRAKLGIDTRFLYYTLIRDDFFNHMMKGAKGTKMPRGDKSQIMRFEIPELDINNQNQIASFLSLLDAKGEVNNRINEELQSMARCIYDYWFVQFDFPDKNGKPYKSSGGKMVWNEDLKRDIPEGWEVDKIGKLFKTSLGGTPTTKVKEYWENGSICWLNSGEIANFPIIDSIEKITKAAIKNSATDLLPRGTVMLSITRHLRPSILAIDACANQSVVGILEKENIKCYFLYPYLQNEIPRLMSLRSGAQQPHINKETVDDSFILLPKEGSSILKEYNSKVGNLYELIINNAFQNQQLASLRDWLLPMLMNGQVKVN